MLFVTLITASFGGIALAQSSAPYVYQSTTPWAPKQAINVDQSAVYNNTYYLSDRTNAGVNVVNLTTGAQIALITGFIEADINGTFSSHVSGPNGLVPVPKYNEIWAGNGVGRIEVISTLNNSIVATIQTGGSYRADEGAYDPVADVVAMCHPDEDVPFVAIVGAANRTLIGKIEFPGAGGLEQTAYDVEKGVFYQSVPSTPDAPGGAICVLDIYNLSITATYPLYQCSPAGIAFGPAGNLFIGCDGTFETSNNYDSSYIMDTSTHPGAIIANITNLTGIDQVAYNSYTNLYYASASANLVDNVTSAGFLGVVDAESLRLVQSIATDNSTAHSVASSETTGELLVPVQEQGIVAYKFQNSASAAGGNGSATGGTVTSGNGSTATGSSPVATYTGGAERVWSGNGGGAAGFLTAGLAVMLFYAWV